MTDLPSCLDCGLCCRPPRAELDHAPGYVELQDAEVFRFRSTWIHKPGPDSYQLTTRASTNGRVACVALGAGNRCTVYERRPAWCQWFERGGAECLAIREDARARGDLP